MTRNLWNTNHATRTSARIAQSVQPQVIPDERDEQKQAVIDEITNLWDLSTLEGYFGYDACPRNSHRMTLHADEDMDDKIQEWYHKPMLPPTKWSPKLLAALRNLAPQCPDPDMARAHIYQHYRIRLETMEPVEIRGTRGPGKVQINTMDFGVNEQDVLLAIGTVSPVMKGIDPLRSRINDLTPLASYGSPGRDDKAGDPQFSVGEELDADASNAATPTPEEQSIGGETFVTGRLLTKERTNFVTLDEHMSALDVSDMTEYLNLQQTEKDARAQAHRCMTEHYKVKTSMVDVASDEYGENKAKEWKEQALYWKMVAASEKEKEKKQIMSVRGRKRTAEEAEGEGAGDSPNKRR